MMADGIAALGKEETIETRDLAEMVAMAMVRS
jgi:hypothetical protein